MLLPFVTSADFEAVVAWCEDNAKAIFPGYLFSKKALNAWVAWRGTALIKDGIRLNCTNPGPTDTAMMPTFEEQAGKEIIDAFVGPSGRRSTAEEQAWPLLFINSPRSSYVAAEALHVDGGFLACHDHQPAVSGSFEHEWQRWTVCGSSSSRRGRSCPPAGAVLADWGADVIKIEHPETGDPQRGLVTMGIIPGDEGRGRLQLPDGAAQPWQAQHRHRRVEPRRPRAALQAGRDGRRLPHQPVAATRARGCRSTSTRSGPATPRSSTRAVTGKASAAKTPTVARSTRPRTSRVAAWPTRCRRRRARSRQRSDRRSAT